MIKSKNNRSIRKNQLPDTRNVVAGIKSVQFYHEILNDNELVIDITNLNVPAGFSNPSPTALNSLKISRFSENLIITSNLEGILNEGMVFELISDNSIKFINSYIPIIGEVFTFKFFNHQISGSLISDIRPDGSTGTLLENTTDFNLGTPVLIEDVNNQWPIQVFRGNAGTPMLRNLGNGLLDGNYQMLDSGDGYCQVIRFNVVGDIGGEPVFWATHGSLAERPNDSVLQRVDKLNGVVDTLRDDSLIAFGFDVTDPTRYNGGVPTLPDLKAFGDRVFSLEKIFNIGILIASDWSHYTPVGSFTTNVTYSAFWRRLGRTLIVEGKLDFTGATNAAIFNVSLPSGLKIDTTNITTNIQGEGDYGSFSAVVSGAAAAYGGKIVYDSETTVRAKALVPGSTQNNTWSTVTQATPISYGSGRSISFRFEFPIQGWNMTTKIKDLI